MTGTQPESVESVLAMSCAAHVAHTIKRCGAPARRGGEGVCIKQSINTIEAEGGCGLAAPKIIYLSRVNLLCVFPS